MRSIADAIKADLAGRRPRVDIKHPRAAGWLVTYRLPVDQFEFEPQRQALLDAIKDGRSFSYEAAVLAVLAEGLTFQGEQLRTADGQAATFMSQEVLDATGAATASQAVRTVYGSDFIVKAVYERLMEAAGASSMGEVIVEDGAPDPTVAG